jgi:hypothetical protein
VSDPDDIEIMASCWRPAGSAEVVGRCVGFDHHRYEVHDHTHPATGALRRWLVRMDGRRPVEWIGPLDLEAASVINAVRGWRQPTLTEALAEAAADQRRARTSVLAAAPNNPVVRLLFPELRPRQAPARKAKR